MATDPEWAPAMSVVEAAQGSGLRREGALEAEADDAQDKHGAPQRRQRDSSEEEVAFQGQESPQYEQR